MFTVIMKSLIKMLIKKQTSPEISVPRTKDVDFAFFYQGWYSSVQFEACFRKMISFTFNVCLPMHRIFKGEY